jgi:hypothetical protein
VADVLSNHGLAQSVGAHQDEIAGFAKEVQRQGTLDDITFDLRGPGPFEVSYGLKFLSICLPVCDACE